MVCLPRLRILEYLMTSTDIFLQIREAGIEILEHKEKTLTEEEAREFYAHKKDEVEFEKSTVLLKKWFTFFHIIIIWRCINS